MLYEVQLGRTCVGFVVKCGHRDWAAYDDSGQNLGRFPDKDSAAAAIYANKETAPVAEGGGSLVAP